MEEILHHLGCIKPWQYWDKLPNQLVSRISVIISTTQILRCPDLGFFNTGYLIPLSPSPQQEGERQYIDQPETLTTFTPSKTNMSPEIYSWKTILSIWNGSFLGDIRSFSEVFFMKPISKEASQFDVLPTCAGTRLIFNAWMILPGMAPT